jgi:hypothetical protein
MEWIFRARAGAQMNASRPEADTEYSRGRRVSRDASGRLTAVWRGRLRRLPEPFRAVPAVAFTGALLLILAELVPVLTIHSPLYHRVTHTITGGANNAWSLLPIAVLALLLTAVAWSSPERPATYVALGLLGLAALGIALLVDLPDVHRAGLIGSPASGLFNARAHAGIGLYLETLGAVALILAGTAGALLSPRREKSARA